LQDAIQVEEYDDDRFVPFNSKYYPDVPVWTTQVMTTIVGSSFGSSNGVNGMTTVSIGNFPCIPVKHLNDSVGFRPFTDTKLMCIATSEEGKVPYGNVNVTRSYHGVDVTLLGNSTNGKILDVEVQMMIKMMTLVLNDPNATEPMCVAGDRGAELVPTTGGIVRINGTGFGKDRNNEGMLNVTSSTPCVDGVVCLEMYPADGTKIGTRLQLKSWWKNPESPEGGIVAVIPPGTGKDYTVSEGA
jgi:hypothetical protein